ncbi:Hypothetical protein FKW44_011504, partial [Caligus rogercresseyi]
YEKTILNTYSISKGQRKSSIKTIYFFVEGKTLRPIIIGAAAARHFAFEVTIPDLEASTWKWLETSLILSKEFKIYRNDIKRVLIIHRRFVLNTN